jgi:hypothetical protein
MPKRTNAFRSIGFILPVSEIRRVSNRVATDNRRISATTSPANAASADSHSRTATPTKSNLHAGWSRFRTMAWLRMVLNAIVP